MESHGELYLAAWGSYGSTGPTDALVRHLRSDVLPAAVRGTDAKALLTAQAMISDLADRIGTSVLQQATEPWMLGRVMALHQMAWFGSTPVGALPMGWVIQVSSPRVPFALGGLAALLCAVAVLGPPSRLRLTAGLSNA